MARYNINTWNAKVDFVLQRIGLNGIHYEYAMPKNYTGPWYENALTVRSKKSPVSKYKNGKKPGQYQPIGDKKYFTFYQIKNTKNISLVDENYTTKVVID